MLATLCQRIVTLRDGRSVVMRPLKRDHFEALRAFLLSLSDEDRLFLRHDIRDPNLLHRWLEEMENARLLSIVAVDGDLIVGVGRLYMMHHGWMRHVGHIRLMTAPTHRRVGLGGMLTRELVDLAAERDLEKLQAHVIEDHVGAVRMFQTIGFQTEAILHGMVKDQNNRARNLAIMVSDVSNLSRLIEDWIQDTMIPAYRVPGGGCG